MNIRSLLKRDQKVSIIIYSFLVYICSMENKKLYVIAGCNGAGKTTASFTILPEILDCKEFVNADEIARGLSPFQPEKVALEAGRLMLKIYLIFTCLYATILWFLTIQAQNLFWSMSQKKEKMKLCTMPIG